MDTKKQKLDELDLEKVVGGGEPVPGADIYLEQEEDSYENAEDDTSSGQTGGR